jgi:hypothetical protein
MGSRMINLDDYYRQQAGTGIAIYNGARIQRGHGFFGRFFTGTLLPLLKSVGHKLLSTGVDVADDVINNDADPLTALRTRGRSAVKGAARDVLTTVRSKLDAAKQSGSGRKTIKRRSLRKRVTLRKSTKQASSKKKRRKTRRKSTGTKSKPRIRRKRKLPKFLEM